MKFRNKTACKIADNLNPDRLNEMIASGDYPCAPATFPGQARLFEERDLASLTVFNLLLKEGHRAKAAARVACLVKEKYDHQQEIQGRLDAPLDGFSDSGIVNDHTEPVHFQVSPIKAFAATTIDLDRLREIVTMRIEEEISVFGED